MSTNVGQQLREARQARNLSLEQASRLTHIRTQHLEALEAGKLEALPSSAQARGFLRTYARYLDLDPIPLLSRLDASPDAPANNEAHERSPAEELAGDIYAEIGEALSTQRVTLGVSLDEVETQIRVRRYYLEAIERGAMGLLPSPVQGRGMLKNYALFLGMDPDPLLLKFADGLQARLAYRRSLQNSAARRSLRPAWRRALSADLLFGGALLVGLILFVIWAVGRVSGIQALQQPAATAPAIVDVLDPQPTATSTPPQQPDGASADETQEAASQPPGGSATPQPPLPISSEDPVQVYIVVIQRTWMRVTVDGDVEFEGRVIPGSAYPFSGRERIQVLTGSGSALEIFYNQQNLGPMGLFGQIVERIYTSDEVLVPTPAVSPTPTPTETPEVTPTPTPATAP